ncbi:MAG: prepilin peptidase [Vulcanibacillus sp.]
MQELIYIITIILLIKIAYIDYKQKIISDSLNMIITLLGILNLILNLENCKMYIASSAITFAVFLFIAIITDGGIGGGDIKLLTALSLIYGSQMLEIIFFSFLLAGCAAAYLIIVNKQKSITRIALGPFICAGTFINLLQMI